MEYLDEEVPQAVGVDEPMEQEMDEVTEPSTQPGVVLDSPSEQPGGVLDSPPEQELAQELAQDGQQDGSMLPSAPVPRIRKVRVSAAPAAPAPAPARPPPHVYWPSRLQEHRDAQRAEKVERYSNLRIY
jgi:hypothetical protein